MQIESGRTLESKSAELCGDLRSTENSRSSDPQARCKATGEAEVYQLGLQRAGLSVVNYTGT